MADADGDALQRAGNRIRERMREQQPFPPPTVTTDTRENGGPRRALARFVTDWRVIIVAALGLLGGGAWGYARWSSVAKKSDLAGVATQADVQRAVDAHEAKPGHAEELRQHNDDRARLERVEGKVEKIDGKVDTVLQLLQSGADRRR